ncbi:hypothetical protein ACJJTC_012104, partial [Scirpophaga incertulas]
MPPKKRSPKTGLQAETPTPIPIPAHRRTMTKRSSQIEEERRTVMATPSPSTPRFLDWTQEDQLAEETPEVKNVELPTFPTPPTPLADTENKTTDRPTLFTEKTLSPSETWKTFRFHEKHATPPLPETPGRKKVETIQEIIVSQPIPDWFDHLLAMEEMLGRDLPASSLNKGCQTKFTPATIQEFEVLWDYLTKNDINIVWPPRTRRSEQQPSAPPTPKTQSKTQRTVAREQPELTPVSEEMPHSDSAKELSSSPTPPTTPTTPAQEPDDCLPSRICGGISFQQREAANLKEPRNAAVRYLGDTSHSIPSLNIKISVTLNARP